jgi:Bax protein
MRVAQLTENVSMSKLLSTFVLACLVFVGSVSVDAAPLVSGRQSMFIKQLLPQVRKANSEVQATREQLEAIHAKWSKSHQLTSRDQLWLQKVAVEYKLKDFNSKQIASWDKLLHRVDVLPESLILAQAIHESAWGTSRIAKQVNNYFGRFCFTSGCGIMPQKRLGKGDTHEIKAFSSIYASVGDYIRNINTHQAYQTLRAERSKMHEKNQDLHGLVLARHLTKYSTNGASYVTMVKAIIQAYKLEKLDTV